MLRNKQPHGPRGRATSELTPGSEVSLLLAAGTQEPWPSGQPSTILTATTEGQGEHLPHLASDSGAVLASAGSSLWRKEFPPRTQRDSSRGSHKVARRRRGLWPGLTAAAAANVLQACGQTERRGAGSLSPAHSNEGAQIKVEQGFGVSGSRGSSGLWLSPMPRNDCRMNARFFQRRRQQISVTV